MSLNEDIHLPRRRELLTIEMEHDGSTNNILNFYSIISGNHLALNVFNEVIGERVIRLCAKFLKTQN